MRRVHEKIEPRFSDAPSRFTSGLAWSFFTEIMNMFTPSHSIYSSRSRISCHDQGAPWKPTGWPGCSKNPDSGCPNAGLAWSACLALIVISCA